MCPDREGDHLYAHFYDRHTKPRPGTDACGRPTGSEPVVSADAWPDCVALRRDSVTGRQYGPIEGDWIPGAACGSRCPPPRHLARRDPRAPPPAPPGGEYVLPASPEEWRSRRRRPARGTTGKAR
ncbi:hypothetical protein ACF05T_29030 [Streptomyces lateritius]|uniref:Uncharacterized protein n=1 Tax=Streptomyces lateritius TaxID=67313 RepID=A0ABW6YKL0_9ACTN